MNFFFNSFTDKNQHGIIQYGCSHEDCCHADLFSSLCFNHFQSVRVIDSSSIFFFCPVSSFRSSSSSHHREDSVHWTHIVRFIVLSDRSFSLSLSRLHCCRWILTVPVELLHGFFSTVVLPFLILPHHSHLWIFPSFDHILHFSHSSLLFSSSCFCFEWKGPHSHLSFLFSLTPLTRFLRTSSVFSSDLAVSVFYYVRVKVSLTSRNRVERGPFCH